MAWLEISTIPNAGSAFSTITLTIHAQSGMSRFFRYAWVTLTSISNS
jgi:hypothetical protein